MTRRMWMAGFCVLLLLGGCGPRGGGAKPGTYPVSGKVVRADGQPLPGGVVVFHPKDPPGNEAMGHVEKDGTFQMGTFGKADGVIPGRYAVTVEPLAVRSPGGQGRQDPSAPFIPQRYWSESTSPLPVIEVRAGENNLPPFRLQ
jgi:hypothetical protein